MLLSGVPILVCPTGLEQSMWAYRISEQGLGSMLNRFNPDPDLLTKIDTAINANQSGNQNHKFAQQYAHYDSQQKVRDIANRITMTSNYKKSRDNT